MDRGHSLSERALRRSVRLRFLMMGVLCLGGLASCGGESLGGATQNAVPDASQVEVSASDVGRVLDSGRGSSSPETTGSMTLDSHLPHLTSVAGAKTVSSDNFRLTLSVGAPAMSPVTQSPSFRLKVFPLRPSQNQESP